MTDYKILKYQQKIKSANDENKKSYYQRKLSYYRKMVGGRSDNIKLMQPMRPSNADTIKNDFYNPDKIIAHGYGILEKEFDLEPVVFERSMPYPNDVVVQILYCGVCLSCCQW